MITRLISKEPISASISKDSLRGKKRRKEEKRCLLRDVKGIKKRLKRLRVSSSKWTSTTEVISIPNKNRIRVPQLKDCSLNAVNGPPAPYAKLLPNSSRVWKMKHTCFLITECNSLRQVGHSGRHQQAEQQIVFMVVWFLARPKTKVQLMTQILWKQDEDVDMLPQKSPHLKIMMRSLGSWTRKETQ